MKNHVFETVTQMLFLVLFTLLVVFISLGIKQDFSRLKTTEFWIEVGAQLAVTMVIFNIVHSMDKRNRMHDEKSRFYKAYATNFLRIKEIESKKLYEELDKVVEQKNQELLEKKCNDKLHKLCTRVFYKDVITNEPIEYVISKHKVFKKREKRFTKLVMKIRTGRIKIKEVKAETFLQDKELLFDKAEIYDFNNAVVELKRNVEKAITFLFCSIIGATITFSFVNPNFWTALVTNLSLFIGAAMSGFFSSAKDIKRKTALYEKRNTFLLKYLDLSVEYKVE